MPGAGCLSCASGGLLQNRDFNASAKAGAPAVFEKRNSPPYTRRNPRIPLGYSSWIWSCKLYQDLLTSEKQLPPTQVHLLAAVSVAYTFWLREHSGRAALSAKAWRLAATSAEWGDRQLALQNRLVQGRLCMKPIAAQASNFRRRLRSLAPSISGQMLALSPSEYSGDTATCVCGRVVIKRGPFDLGTGASGHGKGKKGTSGRGKGKKGGGPSRKLEVHVLGGTSVGDVLFVDAWGDVAERTARAMEVGKVYRLSGGKVVCQSPRSSTSSLPYFFRVVEPLGVKTHITECASSPWVDTPLHHPFATVDSLACVKDSLQVCLLGIVTHQPGVVKRETTFGSAEVCNAVVKQGTHDIRCCFWRTHAAVLARFNEDQAVVMFQVTVKHKADSRELYATEATQVQACPADLEGALRACTDTGDAAAPTTSMTRRQVVDYDSAPAQASTLSGLMSVPVPQVVRDLPGIFEVHGVAVMGVNPVSSDGAWQIRSCAECKRKVADDESACVNHPDAATEQRWLLSLEIADDTGRGPATLYHDAAIGIDAFATADGLADARAQRKAARALRSVPWTIRCVFKVNDLAQTNTLEIKRMVPTLTREGVVDTWTPALPAAVPSSAACPFSACEDVTFDEALGLTLRCGHPVAGARVLVQLQKPSEDETVATPDAENLGLRVQRLARCAMREASPALYACQLAGVTNEVQWLMTAGHADAFLLTVSARKTHATGTPTFNILAHMPVDHELQGSLRELMRTASARTQASLVTHAVDATPTKRLRGIAGEDVPQGTSRSLKERRRLTAVH